MCLSNIFSCLFFSSNDENTKIKPSSNLSNLSNSSEIRTNSEYSDPTYSKFDLDGLDGNFYVDSVYDGDTITIVVGIHMEIFETGPDAKIDWKKYEIKKTSEPVSKIHSINYSKIKVRLAGIDTPEIKPKKNIQSRQEHIAKAKEARDFLSNLILKKSPRIKFLHNDLYGRPLVRIYMDDILINNLMIEKGYAKKYNGGTKDNNF